MPFKPEINHRCSIRLRDYEYSRAGAYFVTICAWQRECLFGEAVPGELRLNRAGEIVRECWDALPDHFPNVELDEFIVMPNHIHGIIVLTDGGNPVGARFIAPNPAAPNPAAPNPAAPNPAAPNPAAPNPAAPNPAPMDCEIQGAMNRAPTVGDIVRSLKARCTHAINQSRHTPGAPVWQRNYYERVIRNEREMADIRQYIANNPVKWAEDENHP
jgi:REP element-mobilizing transposase RayT